MKTHTLKHKQHPIRRTIPIVTLTTILASSAWGQSFVTIQNPGFEDPVISTIGEFSEGVPGWSAFNGGSGGVLNPSAADFPALAPEGTNIASIFSSVAEQESGISQTLTASSKKAPPTRLP